MFAATASRLPDRPALIVRHQNVRLTFGQLQRSVEETARGLCGLGLKQGDRVGIWSSNCLEWILLQLATARTGMVLVNVNPAYRSHEIGFVLQKSNLRALVLLESDARANYRQILDEASHGRDLALEHVVYIGHDSWDRMLAGGVDLPPVNVGARAVANIQYTSGTTGSPKGVLLTHRNILNNAYLIGRQMNITELDSICAPVPLYHCFGCVMASLVTVTTGAALILPAAQFDARATLEAIHNERATALYGVPTMFIAQLEHPDFASFDLTSLRTGIMAGAPCPVEIMKRVIVDMHCPGITIAYGQTESSPVITQSLSTDSLELRVSTVGRVMPQTEVAIVSPETGAVLYLGQQGELCTRGYLVMTGYDDDPEATHGVIDEDGWLHTGDLAIMREDGYFRITGRAKEMIIRGGENIYPREIEEFLFTHPKIADVQVVGLPDARLGEAVLAWIRLKTAETATEDEIREFCSGKIAHFKIPRYIRFVDSFPLTVSGKVQKYKIREAEIESLGLASAANIETA